MLAMADGFAQSTGKPALVNVHTAAGTGNAIAASRNSVVLHHRAYWQLAYGLGQAAPLSTHAFARAPNSFCVPGAGSRPAPGFHPHPTRESSAM